MQRSSIIDSRAHCRAPLRTAAIYLALAFAALPAAASSSAVFDDVMARYENIRLALVDDSLEGVAKEAAEIGKTLAGKSSDPDASGSSDLLPEISELANQLAETSEIEPAREVFYELSKLLVRYRSKVDGDRPAVVYCSMARKSWLQPEGKVGNPYYGKSMEVCGEVVKD